MRALEGLVPGAVREERREENLRETGAERHRVQEHEQVHAPFDSDASPDIAVHHHKTALKRIWTCYTP